MPELTREAHAQTTGPVLMLRLPDVFGLLSCLETVPVKESRDMMSRPCVVCVNSITIGIGCQLYTLVICV